MTEKERFDACIKLAHFWSGRFDSRRQYEWKISLGFWGVLLAAIRFRDATKQILPSSPCLLALILGAVFLYFWLGWLFPLWKRNHFDKAQGFHYIEQGEQLITDPMHKIRTADRLQIEKEANGKFVLQWSMVFHAVTTAALLITLGRLLTKD